MEEATKIMGKIDEKDIQFIALSLSIKNDGIWSNDKHFGEQAKIKVHKTIDIRNLLEKRSDLDSERHEEKNIDN